MAKRIHYIITHHAQERYVERTFDQYAHRQHCRREDCEICDGMKERIFQYVAENVDSINAEIYARLELAEEDRSCINDTNFMDWYYCKYGFEQRFEFLVHDDVLFVVVIDGSKKVVVTCIIGRRHVALRHLGQNNFKKAKRKKTIAVSC